MGPREHRLHWEEDLIMRRLFLVAWLAALLLLQEVGSASLAQGLVRTDGKVGAPEQDPEGARGAHMLETLKHDNQPTGLLVAPKLAAVTWATWQGQGSEAQAGAEGTWGRAPSWDPEPDRDSLYHPPPEEAQGPAQLWPWVLPPQQVLQGPEEDRDHIYHPREAS
ncbi:proline-rich acidic protein 1 isoform X1 [Canis aureus]